MKTYRVVYLPTGKIIGRVEAKSERAAKLRATKLFGYLRWDLNAVIED